MYTTNNCPHNSTAMDNYGCSCLVCGERIGGYGYGGTHQDCLHEWDSAPDRKWKVCIYCEFVALNEHYDIKTGLSNN